MGREKEKTSQIPDVCYWDRMRRLSVWTATQPVKSETDSCLVEWVVMSHRSRWDFTVTTLVSCGAALPINTGKLRFGPLPPPPFQPPSSSSFLHQSFFSWPTHHIAFKWCRHKFLTQQVARRGRPAEGISAALILNSFMQPLTFWFLHTLVFFYIVLSLLWFIPVFWIPVFWIRVLCQFWDWLEHVVYSHLLRMSRQVAQWL